MDATPGESAANMTPPVAPSTSPALRATAPASLAQAAGPSAGSTTAAPVPAPAPAPTRPAVNIPAPSYDDGYDNDPDADYDDDDDCEDGAGAAGYDMGNEHIVRSGYLYKRGEKRKTWKKRWFVLRSSKLAYYKNEKEYQLLRFIDMSEVHTVAAVELKGKDHTFGIVTPSRTFYVNAGSRQEMQAWIDDLNAIKQRSAQTYSTDSAATQQTQLQTSPQPLAALSPSALGQGAISTQTNTLALAQDDLTSIQPTAMSSGPSAMSAQGGGSTGLGGGGILSSSDEDEHDDDWDEDEIADQAMPLPGPALGLTTSVNTNTQLSTSPSAYSSSSNPDAPQMAQMSPQQQALQQPKPGASLLSNPNKVIMQGYLMKQSKGRKHWRKRWFVLSSSRLLYAKDHMNTKAHRVIPISSILDAIEYEHREKDKDRERERDGLTGLTSESSALLSSSPSNTGGGVGGGGAYTSLSAAIPIKQQGDASSNRAARGAVAGLTDSGSETERHKGERESITRTRQRSRSRDMSDGGISASGAASGAAPTGPGAGGAAPSTALLSTSATSSSITHGSTSGDATVPAPPSGASGSGPAAGSTTSSQQQQQPQQQPPQQQQQQQQAASSPILIPTSSPRPPLSQLTSMTLSPGGDAAGTSTTESGAVGGVKARTKRKENCFKIITPKRVYLVCAPSEEEEIKWLSALRALLSTRR
ncbi:hypothetical protein A4X09_0g2950 [Tilletia walkeri]|uniref:PH domain-containing protein n=1 Tax=Tilletia walkeri TaxID=117179 RepID=A0A8X7T620_9BASI|nr:hypothetical protein A4X09_0g2950 [Tilletia walkeri]